VNNSCVNPLVYVMNFYEHHDRPAMAHAPKTVLEQAGVKRTLCGPVGLQDHMHIRQRAAACEHRRLQPHQPAPRVAAQEARAAHARLACLGLRLEEAAERHQVADVSAQSTHRAYEGAWRAQQRDLQAQMSASRRCDAGAVSVPA
jgi:hypothetical protein